MVITIQADLKKTIQVLTHLDKNVAYEQLTEILNVFTTTTLHRENPQGQLLLG